VFLVIALGLVAGFAARDSSLWNYRNALRLWVAAAVVGFPVFIGGYAASATAGDFLGWLSSYQGDTQSRLNELYGIEWTLKGAAVSLSRATFHLIAASTIETAGMGTAIKAVVLREPLEFVPESGKFMLALALIPVIGGTVIVLLFWMVRRLPHDRLTQFAFAWIGAYFLFNIFWSSSTDQFWFQVPPALWLMLMAYLGADSGMTYTGAAEFRTQNSWKVWLLTLSVPALLAANTLQTVVPVSLVDYDRKRAEHMAILRDGDLEIVPGWDGNSWMEIDPFGPRVERLALMDMALQEKASDRHIRHLPIAVGEHLASGGRVVVARLYDKDHGINPWYGLSRLGWPRSKIVAQLDGYCQRYLATVGDVVFREVFLC
jgi:hypothetical protein